MIVNTIYPQAEKSNTDTQQNEAQPELYFSDLPIELQEDLRKSDLGGVFVRAWLVRALHGDCAPAMLLSQYIYWSVRNINEENLHGTFLISVAKIHKQIGMGWRAYKHAHDYLTKRGLVSQTIDKINNRKVTINWQ